MENKGLLFIPDISGFTRFVNQMEIAHSRLIIQELLEILISTNEIGLVVSEVEGDAILFYKVGERPSMQELFRQVSDMFKAFHRQLIAYEYRRFCHCEACQSAINLTLKVITHYGEFQDYHVQQFSQLFGKDIIIAHQLLKNDIDQHEYWLVTKELQENNPGAGLPSWMEWIGRTKQTESGEIAFQYAQLNKLREEIGPDPLPQIELAKKALVVSVTREYDTPLLALFHAIGDFNYRHRWMEGVQAVEEINHFLPRIGMRCRCIMEDGQEEIYTSSYIYHPERIEFSETEEQRNNTTYYILESINETRTRLTLNYYLKKTGIDESLFKLFKKNKTEKRLQRSLMNLDDLVPHIEKKLIESHRPVS